MLGYALIWALARVEPAPPKLTLSLPSNNPAPAGTPAEAQVGPTPFETRPLTFELRLGVAAPTGAVGVALEYSAIKYFAVGCGVGTNLDGLEPACWLRGRLLTGPDRAFSLSSGLSTSHFVDRPGSDAGAFLPGVLLERIGEEGDEGYARIINPLDYRHAVWLNTDIGYERRRDAFVFRFFVGIAALLNPSSGVHLYQPPNSQPRPGAILYAGVGVGFAPKLSSVR